MSMSRREFVAAAASAAAGLALTGHARGHARADDRYFEWKPVGEGVVAAFGAGGNAMVLLGTDASLLVDCKNAPFGPALRREAEAIAKETSVGGKTPGA